MNKLVKLMETKILESLTVQYNARKYNKLQNEINDIFKTLRDNQELKELEPLLTHESPTVVSVVTKFYFIEDEKKAIEAIKELNKRASSGDPELDNMLIEQWKNGELNYLYDL